jgi:hypothetical protein
VNLTDVKLPPSSGRNSWDSQKGEYPGDPGKIKSPPQDVTKCTESTSMSNNIMYSMYCTVMNDSGAIYTENSNQYERKTQNSFLGITEVPNSMAGMQHQSKSFSQ